MIHLHYAPLLALVLYYVRWEPILVVMIVMLPSKVFSSVDKVASDISQPLNGQVNKELPTTARVVCTVPSLYRESPTSMHDCSHATRRTLYGPTNV